MAGQSDIDSINAYLAHLQANGGRLGVNKKGVPVIPASAVAKPAQGAPAAPTAPAAPAAPVAAKGQPGAGAPITPVEDDEGVVEVRNVGKRPERQDGKSGGGIGDFFGKSVKWIASRPTPGGNLALLLILVFFAWAIIPVNHGATRLQLLWLVLTGKADLVDQPDTSQGNDNGGAWWQPYLDPGASASGGGPGRLAAPSLPYEHPSAVEWRPDDILASPRGPGL